MQVLSIDLSKNDVSTVRNFICTACKKISINILLYLYCLSLSVTSKFYFSNVKVCQYFTILSVPSVNIPVYV